MQSSTRQSTLLPLLPLPRVYRTPWQVAKVRGISALQTWVSCVLHPRDTSRYRIRWSNRSTLPSIWGFQSRSRLKPAGEQPIAKLIREGFLSSDRSFGPMQFLLPDISITEQAMEAFFSYSGKLFISFEGNRLLDALFLSFSLKLVSLGVLKRTRALRWPCQQWVRNTCKENLENR